MRPLSVGGDPSRSHTDRAAIPELLALTELVDLCIPRGGRSDSRRSRMLARSRHRHKGICSVYLDGAADADKAVAITVNSNPPGSMPWKLVGG